MIKIFALKNKVIGQFNEPFTSPNVSHALYNIRRIGLEAQERNTFSSLCFPDLELYELGEMNLDTGCITAYCDPILVRDDLSALVVEGGVVCAKN